MLSPRPIKLENPYECKRAISFSHKLSKSTFYLLIIKKIMTKNIVDMEGTVPRKNYNFLNIGMGRIFQIAWFCATAAGILLFLVEVTLISWVKFYPYSPQSAFISTWILFPLLFIFCAFAAHFYRKIFIYNAMAISGDLKDLERMANFSSSEILSV